MGAAGSSGLEISRVAVGKKVSLRRLESGDLEYLYRWENDPEVWRYGDCGANVSGLSAGDAVSEFSGGCVASVFLGGQVASAISGGRAEHGAVPVERDADFPLPSPERAAAPVKRFSREQLRGLIENQKYDISVTGQLRLVICRRADSGVAVYGGEDAVTAMGDAAVGFVDLFDLDPAERSASMGILICDPADRRRGYGREALELMMEYARQELGMRTLWCTIAPDNGASVSLFSGAGFVRREGAHSDGELFFEKRLM